MLGVLSWIREGELRDQAVDLAGLDARVAEARSGGLGRHAQAGPP